MSTRLDLAFSCYGTHFPSSPFSSRVASISVAAVQTYAKSYRALRNKLAAPALVALAAARFRQLEPLQHTQSSNNRRTET